MQGDDEHEKTLFCLEYIGIYTQNLVKYLLSSGGKVWIMTQPRQNWGIILNQFVSIYEDSCKL